MEVKFVAVDASTFILKANELIKRKANDLNLKVGRSECLCEAKDIFLLSQAIEIINDPLTTQECIDCTVRNLATFFCLEDIFEFCQPSTVPGTLPVPFTPANLPFVIGWYDASGLIATKDNVYGTVAATGEVSNWKNLKGDATWDLIQPTLTSQPILDAATSKKQVVFDGVNDYLYFLDKLFGGEVTVFAVAEGKPSQFSPATETQNLISYGNLDANTFPVIDGYFLFAESNDFDTKLAQSSEQDSPPSVKRVESGFDTPVDQKYIVQHTIKHGGDWYMKLNNTRLDAPDNIQNTPAIVNPNLLSVGAITHRIGAGPPVLNSSQVSQFSEIIICLTSDISPSEDDIHTYLKDKWL